MAACPSSLGASSLSASPLGTSSPAALVIRYWRIHLSAPSWTGWSVMLVYANAGGAAPKTSLDDTKKGCREKPSPRRLRRNRRCKPQALLNKVLVCEDRRRALRCTGYCRHCLDNQAGILIVAARPFAGAVRRAGEGLGQRCRYCFPLGRPAVRSFVGA